MYSGDDVDDRTLDAHRVGGDGADGDANAQLTIFTSSGTFTPPSGTSSYIVWVTGG